MTTLTLIVNTQKPKKALALAEGPLPTLEFLQRKLRHLPLGGRKLGDVLDEAFVAFENPERASVSRSAVLSDQLREVGIWLCHPTEDGDPPLYGQVVYPERLVKAYPDLKRNHAQLPGLELPRLAALF